MKNLKPLGMTLVPILCIGAIVAIIGAPMGQVNQATSGLAFGTFVGSPPEQSDRQVSLNVRVLNELRDKRWNYLGVEKRCVRTKDGYGGSSRRQQIYLLTQKVKLVEQAQLKLLSLSKFKQSKENPYRYFISYKETSCPTGYHTDALRIFPIFVTTVKLYGVSFPVVLKADKSSPRRVNNWDIRGWENAYGKLDRDWDGTLRDKVLLAHLQKYGYYSDGEIQQPNELECNLSVWTLTNCGTSYCAQDLQCIGQRYSE